MKMAERRHDVETAVGRLAVRVRGEGPTAVLWHSLFVDDRSWIRVEDELAQQRRLVVITGPGHGRSGDPGRRYSLDDCASAAGAVLDSLEADGALLTGAPVDWVGNAWGGHVGIVFAARWPHRCRTLATFGTPVQALAPLERATSTVLVAAFRVLGPAPFLRRGVVKALMSPRTRRRDAEAVALIEDQLSAAARRPLVNAMISVMLRRRDLASRLPSIASPTLLVTGSAHATWTPQRAEAASRLLTHGQVAVVADTAYLIPLEDPATTIRLLTQLWERELPEPTAPSASRVPGQ